MTLLDKPLVFDNEGHGGRGRPGAGNRVFPMSKPKGDDGAPLVVVVGRSPEYRLRVVTTLIHLYRVRQCGTTNAAMRIIAKESPAVIIVDEDAPPLGGRRFIEAFKSTDAAAEISIILSINPEEIFYQPDTSGGDADFLLVRPFERAVLIQAVSTLVNNRVERSWQVLPILPQTALIETAKIYNGISQSLVDGAAPISFDTVNASCRPLVEAVRNHQFKGILDGVRRHDNYSFAHSIRVATMMALLAHSTGMSQADELLLASGGLLHDAGKITIPHEILNKPGRLTKLEWEIMKGHVDGTMTLLRRAERVPYGVLCIAEQHHEKLNGSGYPHGLVGVQLNELARMAAIVDIFCALTDRRVYKAAMSAETALGIMIEEMAAEIDMHILKLFRHILLDLALDP